MSRIELKVSETMGGERLDRFLASVQSDLSRSRVQALIRDGRVQVNGDPARASVRVKAGDRILVQIPEIEPERIEPEFHPLDVVFEDSALLVVSKPSGMVVHPGAGIRRGTLVHALLHHHPAIASVGGETRPGIVHRLDKDTSGLMVVAKTQAAHRALVVMMQARSVSRTYMALVWGNPPVERGRVEGPIGRDPRDRKRMAVVRRGGKPAVTHWRVCERFGWATRIEVKLETGRTHQIRVHLAHIRHPVIGDSTYGGRGKKLLSLGERERSFGRALLERLPRQALHASELEFAHPFSGEMLRLKAPPPDDLAQAIEWLRARRDDRANRTTR